MKRFIYLFPILLIVTALSISCGSVSSATGGYSDEAKVELVVGNHKPEKVTIIIDKEEPIMYDALNVNQPRDKRVQLIIKPGTHAIKVLTADGRMLYNQKIFVSAGRIKTITLYR